MANISTDYIDKTAALTNKTSTTRKATDELDKNAFLQLLVTQLANQDPLNPTDDREFIAQLAQFSMLEQMENMNNVTMQSQGINLMGKTVTAKLVTEDKNEFVTGVVNSVILKGSNTYLDIEGSIVNMTNIKEIYEGGIKDPAEDSEDEAGTEDKQENAV